MIGNHWRNARILIVNAVVTNKFGVHKTIHPTLKKQIAELGEIPGVDRVILGPSKGVRHNRPVGSLKIQTDVPTGIRMVGYSDRGISEFYVITSEIRNVRAEIVKRFSIE
jgi:hypothetical protein